MPGTYFSKSPSGAIPLIVLSCADVPRWRRQLSADRRAWLKSTGFTGAVGTRCMFSDRAGNVAMIAVGGKPASVWDWSGIAKAVPLLKQDPKGRPRRYHLQWGHMREELTPERATQAALGWALAGYTYIRYKSRPDEDDPGAERVARLVWPRHADRKYVLACVSAIGLVRDLINTPANDMGPAELAAAASGLGRAHKATVKTIAGDRLLKDNYPAIHAVGRASSVAPRLIDLRWGKRTAPKVTLVGKGVCFDSGGLDIKSAAGMKLMKKDMGGAAQVLGIASMVMAMNLPVRLRVLIPAVENSIAGNAMRPGDILSTRKGLTIEVGNTDAEGRVILSDALTEAARENPAVILDFATLTGAARVALGTEVPALFCNDNDMAAEILRSAERTDDPLWHMPLWDGYRAQVTGKVADLNNAPEGGYGGAITAALFLEHFVQKDKGKPPSWAHIDLMAWNMSSRPGRPEGGEAMGVRAVYDFLSSRYGG